MIENNAIPSFATTNRLLSSLVKVMTSFAFTLVGPYPAAESDTIFTCMKSFHLYALTRRFRVWVIMI